MRPLITASTWGFCYLCHFSRPLGNTANVRAQAQHYLGFAPDDGSGQGLEERIAEHLAGQGAKITRACIAQGIEIVLVAAWHAPLAFEKRLKKRKEGPRLCPICCAARGWRRKHPRVLMEQLALPFPPDDDDDFDFPPPERDRADWLEYQIQRGWRAARPQPALATWDDDLL